MITSKRPKKQIPENNERIDIQFEKLIKNVIEEQGYINQSDLKEFSKDLLNEIEPLISKYVKKHFNEIGKYIISITNNNDLMENKDAKNS